LTSGGEGKNVCRPTWKRRKPAERIPLREGMNRQWGGGKNGSTDRKIIPGKHSLITEKRRSLPAEKGWGGNVSTKHRKEGGEKAKRNVRFLICKQHFIKRGKANEKKRPPRLVEGNKSGRSNSGETTGGVRT